MMDTEAELSDAVERIVPEVLPLRADLARVQAECAAMREALWKIIQEIRMRGWLKNGRGSYSWNDDDYRREAGWLMNGVSKIAEEARSSTAGSDMLAYVEAMEKAIEAVLLDIHGEKDVPERFANALVVVEAARIKCGR